VKSDLYIVLAGRFLQVLTSVVLLRLMTVQLGPNEMGKYALITSITSLFALVFINPVGMYINRKTHDWHEKGLLGWRLRQGGQYTLFVMCLAVTIIGIMYYWDLLQFGINVYWLMILVGGSLVLTTFNQTLIPAFNMLGMRKEWVLLSLVTLWSGLGISMILTVSDGRAELWIVGQLAGMLLGMVVALFRFQSLLKHSEEQVSLYWNISQIKPVLWFSLPIALTVGLNWIQFQSYRFIISDVAGLEFLGLFIAGYTLSSGIMSAFEATAMNYFYPIFYSRIDQADSNERVLIWNDYASVMLPLTLYTVIFIMLMSKQLTHILMDKSFWLASQFVVFGAFIEMGRVLGNIYGMIAHATMDTKSLIVPQMIGALSVVVLVLVFKAVLSVDGIGIALVVSALFYVISMHWYMAKKHGIKVNFKKLFNQAIMAIFIIFSWLLSLFIDSSYLSDVIVLLISGVIYIYISYLLLRRSPGYGEKS